MINSNSKPHIIYDTALSKTVKLNRVNRRLLPSPPSSIMSYIYLSLLLLLVIYYLLLIFLLFIIILFIIT